MRDIKFRAWNLEHSKMFDWNYIVEACWLAFDLSEGNNDEVIMQFTGLLDKNGKEIYENDVIETVIDGEFVIYQVCFDVDRDFNGWNVTPQDAEYADILGNVFENPDLLEQGA